MSIEHPDLDICFDIFAKTKLTFYSNTEKLGLVWWPFDFDIALFSRRAE